MMEEDAAQTPKVFLADEHKNRWILLLVLLFAAILGTVFLLNYLRLISLPFLPQKNLPKSNQVKKAPAIEKIVIDCPSAKEFCQKPQAVVKKGLYLGLGANLPANTPLYAVFEGIVQIRTISIATASAKKNEIFSQIVLKNSDKKISAIYLIKNPKLSTKTAYKKGEEIAKITKDQILGLGGYNFVFNLVDGQNQAIFFDKFTFKN